MSGRAGVKGEPFHDRAAARPPAGAEFADRESCFMPDSAKHNVPATPPNSSPGR
ncbi:hypothetical protein ACFV42_10640 [Streptomyces solisilvae]|uniref:hypothetical protein n=1 Tax=Streptomyces malaysiensis TaxID=92644 RepID=UPI00368D13BD